MQTWYFTFGFGHAHPNCYVKLEGTQASSRAEMFRLYGNKWAFQYDEAKALSAIERFRMKEIKVGMTDAAFNSWLANEYSGIADQDGLETCEATIREQLPEERANAVWALLVKQYS